MKPIYSRLPCGCIPGRQLCDEADTLYIRARIALTVAEKWRDEEDRHLAELAWSDYDDHFRPV